MNNRIKQAIDDLERAITDAADNKQAPEPPTPKTPEHRMEVAVIKKGEKAGVQLRKGERTMHLNPLELQEILTTAVDGFMVYHAASGGKAPHPHLKMVGGMNTETEQMMMFTAQDLVLMMFSLETIRNDQDKILRQLLEQVGIDVDAYLAA